MELLAHWPADVPRSVDALGGSGFIASLCELLCAQYREQLSDTHNTGAAGGKGALQVLSQVLRQLLGDESDEAAELGATLVTTAMSHLLRALYSKDKEVGKDQAAGESKEKNGKTEPGAMITSDKPVVGCVPGMDCQCRVMV